MVKNMKVHFSMQIEPNVSSYRLFDKSRRLPGTPADPPEIFVPAALHFRSSRPHEESSRCSFSASPQFEQSQSAHRTHQSSRQSGSHNDPEHFQEESCYL